MNPQPDQTKKKEKIYPYYLIRLQGREVLDYAEDIAEAAKKHILLGDDAIIVKPVTWKTEVTDETPMGATKPDES